MTNRTAAEEKADAALWMAAMLAELLRREVRKLEIRRKLIALLSGGRV